MHLNEFAHILKIVGDKNRLKILYLISKKENQIDNICVSDIAKRLKMSVAITSHHLKVLADAGVVLPKRTGKRICYMRTKSVLVNELSKFINSNINNN